jgi:hypothetical protein
MPDIFAILFAPDSSKGAEKQLIQKLRNIIDLLNIGKADIRVNPRLPIKEYWEGKTEGMITLIIGWGLHSKPSWELLMPEQQYLKSVRQFLAIDLFERKGIDGRVFEKPHINAGKYWSHRIQQRNRNLFFEGYFLQSTEPYALKRMKVIPREGDNNSSMPLYTFEPGKSDEVEIVKIIFDLFVNHDYNRTEICNLLNAQEVKTPKKSSAWDIRIIKTILESPLYIGANQYRKCIKYDVFIPIIEKSVYFEAQAKMAQSNMSASSIKTQQFKPIER